MSYHSGNLPSVRGKENNGEMPWRARDSWPPPCGASAESSRSMGRNQTLWTDVRLATHNCSYLSSASPVRVKQYPISRDAKAGPRKYFCHLREAGILVSCPSPGILFCSPLSRQAPKMVVLLRTWGKLIREGKPSLKLCQIPTPCSAYRTLERLHILF